MTDNRVSFSYTDTQRKILKIPLDFKFKQLPLCRCNWSSQWIWTASFYGIQTSFILCSSDFARNLLHSPAFQRKRGGTPSLTACIAPFTLRRNLYAQNKRQEKLDSKRHALCCRPNLFRMAGLILILTTPQRPPFIGFCRWGE